MLKIKLSNMKIIVIIFIVIFICLYNLNKNFRDNYLNTQYIDKILSKVNKFNYIKLPRGINKDNFTKYLNLGNASFQKRNIKKMWLGYTNLVYPKFENYSDELKNKNIHKISNHRLGNNKKVGINKKVANNKIKEINNRISEVISMNLINDNSFTCQVPNIGINITQLKNNRICGMARPMGADLKDSIVSFYCSDINDCEVKLTQTLEYLYYMGIRCYVNLESFDYREQQDQHDMELKVWSKFDNTKYLHLPTIDMSGIDETNLEKLQDLYETYSDMPIVIHCLCGLGRTGNAILFLILCNNLFREYKCDEVFPFLTYYNIFSENFSSKSAEELFRFFYYDGMYRLHPFYFNLLIDRINKINTCIAKIKRKPFYLYKKYVDTDNWATEGSIIKWLENKKTKNYMFT